MRRRWKFLYPDLSKLDYYLTGSTYVTFDDAILTQSLLVDHSQRSRVVLENHNNGNNTNPAQSDCSRKWTRTIYLLQMTNEEIFGLPFVIIPLFIINKRNKKFLWLT